MLFTYIFFKKNRLSTIPMGDLFSSMPLMLDAQKAEEEGAEEKAR